MSKKVVESKRAAVKDVQQAANVKGKGVAAHATQAAKAKRGAVATKEVATKNVARKSAKQVKPEVADKKCWCRRKKVCAYIIGLIVFLVVWGLLACWQIQRQRDAERVVLRVTNATSQKGDYDELYTNQGRLLKVNSYVVSNANHEKLADISRKLIDSSEYVGQMKTADEDKMNELAGEVDTLQTYTEQRKTGCDNSIPQTGTYVWDYGRNGRYTLASDGPCETTVNVTSAGKELVKIAEGYSKKFE